MPEYKVYLQKNGEIREGLRCSYCRLVLRDPIQTSETGQRYCRECFTEAARSVLNLHQLDDCHNKDIVIVIA